MEQQESFRLDTLGVCRPITIDSPLIPGPVSLQAGDTEEGFYGVVPSEHFINGWALAKTLGLNNGHCHHSLTDWFKFSYQGNIAFIPRYTLRHSIVWEEINDKYLSFEIDDKVFVVIGKMVYLVRLIQGANTDPAPDETGYDLPHVNGDSEWNRLMMRIHQHPDEFSDLIHGGRYSSGVDNWDSYTDDQLWCYYPLGAGTGSWCYEEHPGSYGGDNYGYESKDGNASCHSVIYDRNYTWEARLDAVGTPRLCIPGGNVEQLPRQNQCDGLTRVVRGASSTADYSGACETVNSNGPDPWCDCHNDKCYHEDVITCKGEGFCLEDHYKRDGLFPLESEEIYNQYQGRIYGGWRPILVLQGEYVIDPVENLTVQTALDNTNPLKLPVELPSTGQLGRRGLYITRQGSYMGDVETALTDILTHTEKLVMAWIEQTLSLNEKLVALEMSLIDVDDTTLLQTLLEFSETLPEQQLIGEHTSFFDASIVRWDTQQRCVWYPDKPLARDIDRWWDDHPSIGEPIPLTPDNVIKARQGYARLNYTLVVLKALLEGDDAQTDNYTVTNITYPEPALEIDEVELVDNETLWWSELDGEPGLRNIMRYLIHPMTVIQSGSSMTAMQEELGLEGDGYFYHLGNIVENGEEDYENPALSSYDKYQLSIPDDIDEFITPLVERYVANTRQHFKNDLIGYDSVLFKRVRDLKSQLTLDEWSQVNRVFGFSDQQRTFITNTACHLADISLTLHHWLWGTNDE